MDSAQTQVTLPAALAQQYEELAHTTGQRQEDLMVAALEAYLAGQGEDDARLAAAIAAADRGETVDSDEADSEIEALLRARGVSAGQLAAAREEARREVEAFYGVSLSCCANAQATTMMRGALCAAPHELPICATSQNC